MHNKGLPLLFFFFFVHFCMTARLLFKENSNYSPCLFSCLSPILFSTLPIGSLKSLSNHRAPFIGTLQRYFHCLWDGVWNFGHQKPSFPFLSPECVSMLIFTFFFLKKFYIQVKLNTKFSSPLVNTWVLERIIPFFWITPFPNCHVSKCNQNFTDPSWSPQLE